MTTEIDLASKIAECKAGVENAKGRLLRTFGYVPDDKLNHKVADTCYSPLQLIGHVALSNHAMAGILTGNVPEIPEDPEARRHLFRWGGTDVATREEAVAKLEESTAVVLAALDAVTEEQLDSTPDSPFGAMPYTFWMGLPAMHMQHHAAQVDFIQTVWGDLEDHF